MYKRFIKRGIDLFLSILAFPFVVLIIIVFGILIKIEDRGPIFFNAERVGQYGKIFKMYKLRSMKVNAPDIRLEDGSTFNSKNDDRVTRVGKLIRKTSLDEFPQFINVIKGDMSIVGPRPDPTDWLEKYPEDMKGFLNAKPGITGYSQAYFRNSVDGYEKMKNDLYYSKNISLGLDCKVFFKTILSVIGSENMYKEDDLKKR